MSTIKKFEELVIWQNARKLINEIYKEMNGIKDFGFKDQIQRASVSIMNNIAEGFERYSDTEFRRFLDISKASCGEVRSMLYLAEDLHYLNNYTAENLRKDCRLISGSIQNSINSLKS
ncbi:four helix bundle protein [Labilibaculum euxinus]